MKYVTVFLLGLVVFAASEIVVFDNSWGEKPLFNLVSSTRGGVEIVFSSHRLAIDDQVLDGVTMQSYGVPAVFIAEPGLPNLTGANRYLAIPQGARPEVVIRDCRVETYQNIEIAPAPNIPKNNDDSPLRYKKNMAVYGRNAYWPDSPVKLSAPLQIRGVDVVVVGVIPFQYNPVTKELVVYKDIRFEVRFVGGNGQFGVDALRGRTWEPILQQHLLNYSILPRIDFYSPERVRARDGCEYIIIVPDDAAFIAWADTLKRWRKLQGISTEVYTITQVGGNTTTAIENFLNNAYNTWNPRPEAFLLLSDYQSSGKAYGITSPVWSSYCVSDNIYADVNNDNLPDMHHGRICAQNQAQLATIINKLLSYERNPYTAPNFYDNPLVACGWQNDRWFQLAAEVCRGYLINVLSRNPARQYNLGSPANPVPGCAWSTRQGTTPVVAYWNALGYIPLTNPYNSTWWNNGSAAGVNAALNSGAFFVQHRDHGSEYGWSEPDYDTTDLNGLTNTMYTFVNSTNCLTGAYNRSYRVFAEKFHRIQYGALGLNAASEVSYSFVNDTYIWGMWDCLFPAFDPGYPTTDMTGYGDLRPCFAQTYGKYYLRNMWFPDSVPGVSVYRVYTYHLFHHHGDAFMTLYSVVPMDLTVNHPATIFTSTTAVPVSANDSSVICLTVNGEIIGVAEGTGSYVDVAIPAQTVGTTITVTVTKANYRRYTGSIQVVALNYPYVVIGTTIVNDTGGDHIINPGESVNLGVYAVNLGQGTAQQVYGLLSESDAYTTLAVDSSWFGNISQADSELSAPFYSFAVANNTPDSHMITLAFDFHDASDTIWTGQKQFRVHSPELVFQRCLVLGGDGNGILDPGETDDLVVTIRNTGSAAAVNAGGRLRTASPYITITDSSASYGTVNPPDTVSNTGDVFTVDVSPTTPIGTMVQFDLELSAFGYCDTASFSLQVHAVAEEPGLMNLVAHQTLAVCPSVSAGEMTIVYRTADGVKNVGLQIYDAGGRLVKTFARLKTGPFCQVPWFGEDETGRKVPTGIYFMRLELDDLKVVEKALIIR